MCASRPPSWRLAHAVETALARIDLDFLSRPDSNQGSDRSGRARRAPRARRPRPGGHSLGYRNVWTWRVSSLQFSSLVIPGFPWMEIASTPRMEISGPAPGFPRAWTWHWRWWRRTTGDALALEIARRMVLFMRRGAGQSQFSSQLAVQAADHQPIRDLIAWISEHLDADLSVLL